MENNFDEIISFYKSDENQEIIELFHDEVVNYFRKNRLLNNREFPIIHSVKSRIKDAYHLKDKLLRQEKKGNNINLTNFFEKINDLIGVRILHLHQEQFSLIHNEILKKIQEGKWTFHEEPKAYTWDLEAQKTYEDLGIKTEVKESLYTSVHYVIKLNDNASKSICCEIQVRSLFEEIWGEIDHTINYPHETKSVACKEQIRVLSKLISTGSRLTDSIFRSHKEHLHSVLIKQENEINEEHSKSIHDKVANSIYKIITEQEKKSGKQYSEFIKYSDYSLADSNFPLFESDILTQIISNLKIHNWYIQNPAIELLLKQNLNILQENQTNNDKLFVIGRNIYQSACGGAKLSIDIINNLKQYFTKYSDYIITNIYSGILYEIYFDSNNNFREDTKSKFIDQIFELENFNRLEKSISFIRESLKYFEEKLFIIPNLIPEYVTFDLSLNIKNINNEFQNEDTYKIISLKINNEELIVNENKASITNNFDNYNDLINTLSHLYTIPKKKFNLFTNDFNKNLRLFIPYEKGIYKK